jgi:HEAT repeat protein
MDQTLKRIVGLLKHHDPMRRSGAVLVLAELAPRNKDIVKALGEILPEAGQQLSGYILEALQAIGLPAAVPYVMPLLNSQDMAIRMRASAIVACGGSAVVPEIKRQFKEVPRQQKLVFIDLLARIHTSETLQMLLDLLFEPDFGLIKETCDAVKRHAAGTKPPERLKLHKQVVKFMNSTRVKQQERVLTSSLLLLGHIGRPEAATILLKYSSPKINIYIRRHALIALKGVEFTGKTASTILRKIFPYLEETEEDIVRLTIDIIQRMPSPDISAAQWRKLLKNKHGSARAFAARMLSGTDTNDNNSLLIDLLSHEDNELREIAANALAGHKKATSLLLKALASENHIETAWSLARILKQHSEAINKKTVKKFATLSAREMLAGKPRYEPLLILYATLTQRPLNQFFWTLAWHTRKPSAGQMLSTVCVACFIPKRLTTMFHMH